MSSKGTSDRSSWQSNRLLVWTCQRLTRHVPCAARMHRRCAVVRNCKTAHLSSVGAAHKSSPWDRLVNGCAITAIKPSLAVWDRWIDQHTVLLGTASGFVKPEQSKGCHQVEGQSARHSTAAASWHEMLWKTLAGQLGSGYPSCNHVRQCQYHHTSERNPTSATSTNAQD